MGYWSKLKSVLNNLWSRIRTARSITLRTALMEYRLKALTAETTAAGYSTVSRHTARTVLLATLSNSLVHGLSDGGRYGEMAMVM